MALGDAGYLPPVVASLLAESGDFVAKVMEAKAILADFSRSDTTTKIGADILPLETTLTTTKLELLNFAKEVTRARLGADARPFWEEISLLRAQLEAMSSFDIKIDAEIKGALLKLAELKGALAMLQTKALEIGGAGGGEGGGGGGFLAGLLGGAAGRGGLGGLLGFLGWGKGQGIPWLGLGGMAGFGTPLGLAGFGADRILTTALGIGGSMAGGLAGGGLLGLGALGVAGVGGGADMAVMRSTIADVRTLGTEYNRLQRAIAIYGEGSIQARAAQYDLNQTMQQFTPAAAQAQLALAQHAQAVNAAFDMATSGARIQATKILDQVLGLASTYIPLVARAAERNLGIINTSLKPLFDYLQGPATEVFNKLENMFADRLPIAVDAFTQGIILLIRTIDAAANYTGQFLPKLDKFLQYANSPTGFDKWIHDIGTLIDLFRTWERFFFALGKLVFDIFAQSAGLGKSVAESLTDMINKLDRWVTSTTGKKELNTLFESHKDQILAILQLLPALGHLAEIYITLAPAFTQIVTGLINFTKFLIHLPGIGPVMEYALAFVIIAARLGILAPIATGVFRLITSEAVLSAARTVGAWLLAAAQIIASWAIVTARSIATGVEILAAQTIAAARTAGVWLLAQARMIAGWIAQAVAAVARVAIIVAVNVAGAATTAAAWAVAWIVASAGLVLLVVAIGVAVALIISHWGYLKSWFADMWSLTVQLAEIAWRRITTAAGDAKDSIIEHLNSMVDTAQKLPNKFYDIGQDIVRGIVRGIQNMIPWGESAIADLIARLVKAGIEAGKGGSPFMLFAELMGIPIAQGVAVGITRGQGPAIAALVGLNNALATTARGLSRPALGGGAFAFAGAGGGGSTSINMPITVNVSGAAAASPQGIGSAVGQEVAKQLRQVLKAAQAGAYVVPGQAR